jgi:hypothetical protein
LGFETIPTVIQDISHTEFLLKYVIWFKIYNLISAVCC